MGKRSAFARIERDDYPTPLSALPALLAQLAPHSKFIEPAAGRGDLVRHLEAAGHHCVGRYDLPDDARTTRYPVTDGTVIITNPPGYGRRDFLAELIENLSDQAETWLLLPFDWLANTSSAQLVNERLRLVVPIGRIRWFPNSPHTSLENYAWLLFDYANEANVAHIVGRLPSGVPTVNRAAPTLSPSPSAADLREVHAET
jgi:hypothetical protein